MINPALILGVVSLMAIANVALSFDCCYAATPPPKRTVSRSLSPLNRTRKHKRRTMAATSATPSPRVAGCNDGGSRSPPPRRQPSPRLPTPSASQNSTPPGLSENSDSGLSFGKDKARTPSVSPPPSPLSRITSSKTGQVSASPFSAVGGASCSNSALPAGRCRQDRKSVV